MSLQEALEDYLKGGVPGYGEEKCAHGDCDCEHFLYEILMESFYGPKVWDYINDELIL